jgi:tellurite resistance protein
MAKALSHPEALIYVMVTTAAVDGVITDQELRRIGNIVSHLPVFAEFDPEMLVPAAEDCGKLLASKDGLDKTLDQVAKALPQRLYETAYALAVDVAAADLKVEQEEIRFLEMLGTKFDLSKLVVAAIERGARARHRVS